MVNRLWNLTSIWIKEFAHLVAHLKIKDYMGLFHQRSVCFIV